MSSWAGRPPLPRHGPAAEEKEDEEEEAKASKLGGTRQPGRGGGRRRGERRPGVAAAGSGGSWHHPRSSGGRVLVAPVDHGSLHRTNLGIPRLDGRSHATVEERTQALHSMSGAG